MATRNFSDQCAAQIAAWLALLVLPITVWLPFLLRENLSYITLGVILYSWSLLYRRKWVLFTANSVVAIVLINLVRQEFTIVLLAGILILSVRNVQTPHLRMQFIACATPVLLLGAGALVQGNWLGRYLTSSRLLPVVAANSQPGNSLGIPEANSWASYEGISNDGASETWFMAMLRRLSEADVLFIIPVLPDRLLKAVLGPLPNEWGQISMVLIGIEGLLLFVVMTTLCFAALWLGRLRTLLVLTVAGSAFIFLGLAWTLANYGIILRGRSQVWLLTVPLAAATTHEIIQLLGSRKSQ